MSPASPDSPSATASSARVIRHTIQAGISGRKFARATSSGRGTIGLPFVEIVLSLAVELGRGRCSSSDPTPHTIIHVGDQTDRLRQWLTRSLAPLEPSLDVGLAIADVPPNLDSRRAASTGSPRVDRRPRYAQVRHEVVDAEED